MNEDQITFAATMREKLNTWRMNEGLMIVGQATFSKNKVGQGIPPLTIVVTNVDGKYTFDFVTGGDIEEVDITLIAEDHE